MLLFKLGRERPSTEEAWFADIPLNPSEFSRRNRAVATIKTSDLNNFSTLIYTESEVGVLVWIRIS